MSRFTTPLRFEDTGIERKGRAIFRIIESFDYELGAVGSGLIIRVPVNFETDFGSIPRFFWRLFPPWGRYGKAFVLHDLLYRKASGFSKAVADAILYEALEQLGAPWWERMAIYEAVHIFGKWAYQWEAESPEHTELKMLEQKPDGQLALKPEFKTPQETLVA